MTTKNTPKIRRLENALNSGKPLTTTSIINRFGFASVNSVTRAVATLRQEGYRVATVVTRNGATAYQAA